ncbi:DNA mismatch repair endonuclease MutL [Lachnoclostridium phytofermentans]|uniref:DNA mismatch repair protein MutL n=1 Tax=Lachnoclostridium phytofermentans (strain ATCC 700394 / DSM 18823 / ISDg) TaxID=357809 RepID=A9KL09_LACP7|nr:DNA mismatch repair endonuclease MutL [Lachnoclostridium phytofermentans]ABX42741.1 DNA mismatch repair protein MutL [Lachnoclostridium phytofermentans ISDg]
MAKIALLDQSTINQIAAGEVVERPASVVKELIENAIDAGATAVTAEIKDGGISFIRITDNGAGIEKDDIPTAFLRHSTSKIQSIEDLLTIGSLGFRGEALSSIASVAQVELVTKTRTAFTGIRYLIEGGEEQSMTEIGCPDGTTFIVRNLFFNTPARRKFLKSAMTEASYISDLMERLAVSHPDISFKFINNNKTVLHTFGNSQLKDIIYHVYGRTIAAEVVTVENGNEHISISGYIGKPIISRGNRNYENYFINGRYIKSNIINKAIEEAYRPYSMQHKYPFTAIHFSINPEFIDVNVHPTKMEVRFHNFEELYQLTLNTIRDALNSTNMIPKVSLSEEKESIKKEAVSAPEPFEENRRKLEKETRERSHTTDYQVSKGRNVSCNLTQIDPKKEIDPAIKETEIGRLREVTLQGNLKNIEEQKLSEGDSSYRTAAEHASYMESTYAQNETMNTPSISYDIEKETVTSNIAEEISQISLFPQKEEIIEKENLPKELSLLSEEGIRQARIIGQAFKTYWFIELENQLYIIDQHAAHEKVLYESTMKRLKEKETMSQQLCPPVILTLNLREEEAIKTHREFLSMLGFEIEPFGGKEYAVSAVPADMFGLAGERLLIEFIDDLVEEISRGTPDVILEKIASLSCKAAVKGNYNLSVEEANELLKQLLTLENPFHCPHGRPIIISMTKYELEKKFKRVL